MTVNQNCDKLTFWPRRPPNNRTLFTKSLISFSTFSTLVYFNDAQRKARTLPNGVLWILSVT